MIVSVFDAVKKLKENKIVAIPTETVYGLAARIHSVEALQLIFSTKKRPFFDPLIVHVSSIDQAKKLTTDWNEISNCLALNFWPGPLTLVVPKNSDVISDLITSGLAQVGIRLPNHPMAIDIINSVGEPLAAPSANLFGRTSPSDAHHVETEFQSQVPVVDGGACQIGIESTVLLIQDQKISLLRPGQITQLQIENCLQKNNIPYIWNHNIEKKFSPGHMKHHYMPAKPLFGIRKSFNQDALSSINQQLKNLPDSVEGVTINKPTQVKNTIELILPDNPVQAARVLYSELRRLEKGPEDAILFHFKTQHELPEWLAIRERLEKACSMILES